jgi:hypothetical protein
VTELIEGSEIEDHTAAIASRLKALTAVAEEIGADRIDRDASDLDERLAHGRFFVACVGQFKRGKSSRNGSGGILYRSDAVQRRSEARGTPAHQCIRPG